MGKVVILFPDHVLPSTRDNSLCVKCRSLPFMGEVAFEEISMNIPLLPDHHPKGDFFVCDIFDAAP